MIKLTVVIVNYNVKHFLQQCLHSVVRATTNIKSEIFVVDNNSTDNSVKMLQENFPQVTIIANKENLGFAKANNQAFRLAQGEYVLLLNPDTLVEEDTFEKIIRFMDNTADAGALGVKMINGKGEFLPESKRGLPIPSVAFYKIFGLAKFFPKSKKFGSYHLTYLSNDKIHSVEVLSGAFMFVRRTVLEEVGYLDEDYFMYGEDIDLSYKIIQKGYKNYYFPHTKIIHYKGESTKKSSINYVFVFYRAMQIFAKKHFKARNAKLVQLIINFAIWFRASLAVVKRIFVALLLPLIDFVTIYAGVFAIAKYWEINVLSERTSSFPLEFYIIVIPLYISILILSMAINKGYKKLIQLYRTNRGFLMGVVLILLIYALLPESFRFSRAVVVFGSMWGIIAVNAVRYLLHRSPYSTFHFEGKKQFRTLLLGEGEEAHRVMKLILNTNREIEFLRVISLNDKEKIVPADYIIGDISQLKEIILIYKIKEVVFCSQTFSYKEIINYMELLKEYNVDFKIVPENSNALIGSNSIITPKNHINAPNLITLPANKLKKRTFDIIVSILLLISYVFTVWFVKNRKNYFNTIFNVLKGRYTWVGFVNDEAETELPTLPKAVVSPSVLFPKELITPEIIAKINQEYSNNYKLTTDILVVFKSFKKLGC